MTINKNEDNPARKSQSGGAPGGGAALPTTVTGRVSPARAAVGLAGVRLHREPSPAAAWHR